MSPEMKVLDTLAFYIRIGCKINFKLYEGDIHISMKIGFVTAERVVSESDFDAINFIGTLSEMYEEHMKRKNQVKVIEQ